MVVMDKAGQYAPRVTGMDINLKGQKNDALIVTQEQSVRMELNQALLATSVVGTDEFVQNAPIAG